MAIPAKALRHSIDPEVHFSSVGLFLRTQFKSLSNSGTMP
jgi:hypothetical protein